MGGGLGGTKFVTMRYKRWELGVVKNGKSGCYVIIEWPLRVNYYTNVNKALNTVFPLISAPSCYLILKF